MPKLPARTFTLDRAGLARVLSLPVDRDDFSSDIINSYRVKQGVLHNPKSDRRTTAGIFHVAEGGLPIPDDKLGVPKTTFAKMLQLALTPPQRTAETAVHLHAAAAGGMFRLAAAAAAGLPGGARLHAGKDDGSPLLRAGQPRQQSGFRRGHLRQTAATRCCRKTTPRSTCEHWTGHTGCVILAPHLTKITKKSVGLPHFDQATERQRRDGMCWKKEDELYNDGNAFKLTARDETGVIVTIIADNYFGYCKKEVKTQLSYAANLFGLAEEEHAGGALVFPELRSGRGVQRRRARPPAGPLVSRKWLRCLADVMDVKPEGYAVDKKFPEIVYVPARRAFRSASAKSFLDERHRRSQHQALAGKNLRPPVRLQGADGKTARHGPAVAARRHRGRGHVLPQALHGFRRRQIGNFQAHHRRDSHRPGVRRGFEKGF